jgi:hypothetical protein
MPELDNHKGKVVVWTKKPTPEEGYGFGFPAAEAELLGEHIDELKMRPALTRLARRLLNQIRKKHPNVIGVTLEGVTFTTLFKR